MSWRIETEPTGEKAIVISGWEKGIADSAYNGIQDLRNANTISIPGEVSSTLGASSAMATSGATMDELIHYAIDLGSGGLSPTYYVLDKSGNVFKLVTSTWTSIGATTTSAGADNQGLCYFPFGNSGNGYLFRFRADKIDYYDGASWTNGWKTITGGVSHYAILSFNGALYFCNGGGVGKIEQATAATFDPTNAATYNYSAKTVPLPNNDTATCLAELSQLLLIGGVRNAIYPWNRVDAQPAYPILLADQYVKNMVAANTNAFVFTGNANGRGRIYVTNGTNAEPFFKMPDQLAAVAEPYWVWGSSTYASMNATWHRNNLIFGANVTTNGGTSIQGAADRVFALDLTTKALRSVGDFPSSPSSGTIVMPLVAGTSATGMGFYAGFYNGSSTYGIVSSVTNLSQSISGTYTTDFVPIGTFLNVKTFTSLEYKLSQPLSSNESISVYYRNNLNTGFQLIKSFTTAGLIADIAQPLNFEKQQWIQFQIITSAASGGSGVRLRELRIR